MQQGDPPKTYNVTEIGRFYGNKYITSLTISEGIQKISDEAFMNCTGLTGDLTIPESVTTIGSSAFYGCSGFTGTLEIPSEVTVINSSSFKNCSGLTGLELPPALTTINSSAFEGCTGMTGTLNLPDTLTTVDISAFDQCGFTGSLTLPEGLTYLGGASFGCPEISGILTIPSSVTSAAENPFTNMFNVRKIVNNATAQFTLRYNFISESDNNTFFVKEGTTEHLTKYYYVDGNKQNRKLGQGVYLRNGEEYGCVIRFDANGGTDAPETSTVNMDQEIVLPATMPTRTNWYFLGWSTTQNATAAEYWPGSGFTPAESVTFYAVWGQPDLLAPDDLMVIDAEAFAGSDFRFAALNANSVEIRQNAFAGCPNLTAVYIPSAAAVINPDAFGDRQNLPKMTLLGPADGAAQTFAETHGFGFIPVE